MKCPEEKKRSNVWLFAILILCAVLSAGMLLYELETYIPHADSGYTALCVGAVAACIASWTAVGHIISVMRGKKPIDRALLLTAVVSIAVCGCAMLIAEKIPLCAQCEGITRQELGVLAHWISTGP